MKGTTTALLWALLCINANAQDKRLDGLDTTIQKLLTQWKVAGVSVAIVEKNKVILAKGYGYRNIENKLPVTDETLFAIGSCTKAFTSSLLGMLAFEGKLDLNRPVNLYMPELRFIQDELTNHVTALDMMCHRTGLPRHDLAWYGAPHKRDSLLYRIRFFENSYQLREKWQYNNFMFMAQGCLTEKITGKKWEDLLKEKIFDPLEMKISSPYISAMQQNSNAATGYKLTKDSLIKTMEYLDIDAIGPAGSINSNSKEMSNWLLTWINGGKFKEKQIIPPIYVTDAGSSQMVIRPALPSKDNPDVFFSNYGLGWFLSSYRGHYRIDHGGNIDGFSTNVSFFPSDSVGIIVMANQNASPLPAMLRNIIADKMLRLSYRNWPKVQQETIAKSKKQEEEAKLNDPVKKKSGTHPSHLLADYTGTYTHPGYGSISFYLEGDSLKARYNKMNLLMKHFHYDIFEGLLLEDGVIDEEADKLKFQFGMSLNGEIECLSVKLEEQVKNIIFKKDGKLDKTKP